MADNLQKQLEYIYELIRREQADEALELLRPLLEEHNDNADIWWLLANAVDDPRQARRALVNVLKINPRHARARGLLDKLNESYPPRDDELMMMMEMPEADDPFTLSREDDEDEDVQFDDPFADGGEDGLGVGDDDDPFAELLVEGTSSKKGRRAKKSKSGKAQKSQARRRSPLRTVVLLLIVVLAVVVALAVLLGGGEGDTGEADAAAIEPVVVEETELQSILAFTIEDVRDSTSPSFGPNSTAVYAETGAGRTLFVQGCICTTAECQGPGPDALGVMTFAGIDLAAKRLANTAEAIRGQIQAVGVNITSCVGDSVDTLYRAFVDLNAVNEFTRSGDRAAFQARWVKEG